ncbi:hypothetical protein [Flavobacterium lacisediminis]|uniref:Uncharacterized protein n=1 Tax=Flavobacterium lacisediminis TaxID=2989705 RepID=A0ABT3EK16_9FLAO|nr:hypothetical protein [Flavobacterium lacisediminis]MCW1148918.1 hypothetical protein [Flavobacterium lacisediminis]
MEEVSKKIYRVMFIVALPIIIFAYLFVNYQNNNLNVVKEDYEKIRNIEFSGLVIEKKKDGNYPRANRYIYLTKYHKVIISSELYTKIKIGDSVSKPKNCDSIYFYLKNGDIEIEDFNQFGREKYLNLLNKKE